MTAHIEEVDDGNFARTVFDVKSARFGGFLGAMVRPMPGPCADR
jgi:hypothetical protein